MRVALGDRLRTLRNRWLANPRFQKWAAGFPLTRRTSRRHARALFDLCAGFVYSQVLLACVQLNLFELLAEGPLHSSDIAKRAGLDLEAAERLLGAAAALTLLERYGEGRYGLGILGAALRGNPAVVAMIQHHALFYRDLAEPVALLRGTQTATELSRLWGYATNASPERLDESAIAAYTTLMSRSQALVADEVLDAYPVRLHACVMDVGGGEGTFLLKAAERARQARLVLFDLPAVADRAQHRFAAAGLADRAQATGGSFLTDALPAGADLITLVRVLHDHNDDAALALLRNVRAALPRGGVLLIAEPLKGIRGTEAVGDAYFELYFLAMGQGHARTVDEVAVLLEKAGFTAPRSIPTRQPLQTQVLIARPRAYGRLT